MLRCRLAMQDWQCVSSNAYGQVCKQGLNLYENYSGTNRVAEGTPVRGGKLKDIEIADTYPNKQPMNETKVAFLHEISFKQY